MSGAENLSADILTGSIVINVDSEEQYAIYLIFHMQQNDRDYSGYTPFVSLS